MLILAGAPPIPLGGKIVVALVMFGLFGLLVRVIRGVPSTRTSIGRAIVVTVGVVVGLEVLFPSRFDPGLDGQGVLAALIGAIAAGWLLRPAYKEGQRRTSHSHHLSGAAFISGPLVGFSLAYLTVHFLDVSPLDRANTFGVFIGIGLLAGVVGALVLMVALPSEAVDSSRSDKQN